MKETVSGMRQRVNKKMLLYKEGKFQVTTLVYDQYIYITPEKREDVVAELGHAMRRMSQASVENPIQSHLRAPDFIAVGCDLFNKVVLHIYTNTWVYCAARLIYHRRGYPDHIVGREELLVTHLSSLYAAQQAFERCCAAIDRALLLSYACPLDWLHGEANMLNHVMLETRLRINDMLRAIYILCAPDHSSTDVVGITKSTYHLSRDFDSMFTGLCHIDPKTIRLPANLREMAQSHARVLRAMELYLNAQLLTRALVVEGMQLAEDLFEHDEVQALRAAIIAREMGDLRQMADDQIRAALEAGVLKMIGEQGSK